MESWRRWVLVIDEPEIDEGAGFEVTRQERVEAAQIGARILERNCGQNAYEV